MKTLASSVIGLVLFAFACGVIIAIATFISSGISTPDMMISIYCSLLEASVTIAAFVSIFMSWVVERKINRGLEILDQMQENQWAQPTPEVLEQTFERMKDQYGNRYRNAELPKKLKGAIMVIYIPCIVVGVSALVTIGYLLEGGKMGVVAFIYISAAALMVASLLAFGFFLFDLMSLKKGWLFILPDLDEFKYLGSLRAKIGLDFKAIIKLGLIRVRAAIDKKGEYCLLLIPKFEDLESHYEVVFVAEEHTWRIPPRAFKVRENENEDNTEEISIRKNDFPPAFQEATPWTLRIELDGPFPEDFWEDSEEKDNKRVKRKLFSRIQYIFEDVTKGRSVDVLTDLRVKEISYQKPGEQQNGFTLKETWHKIYQETEEEKDEHSGKKPLRSLKREF